MESGLTQAFYPATWLEADERCEAYILGVVDAWLSLVSAGACSLPCSFDIVRDVPSEKIFEVVFRFIKERPEQLRYSAASVILSALLCAYPPPGVRKEDIERLLRQEVQTGER